MASASVLSSVSTCLRDQSLELGLFHSSRHHEKKVDKHSKDMTTDETVKHLFHPKVVEHLNKHAEKKGKSK